MICLQFLWHVSDLRPETREVRKDMFSLFALFEAWIGGGVSYAGHLRSCRRTSWSRRKIQVLSKKSFEISKDIPKSFEQTMLIPLRRKISSGLATIKKLGGLLARNMEGRAQRWWGSSGRGCLCCCWGIMWQCSVPGCPAIHLLIWMETKTRTVIYLYTYTADILEVLLKCC